MKNSYEKKRAKQELRKSIIALNTALLYNDNSHHDMLYIAEEKYNFCTGQIFMLHSIGFITGETISRYSKLIRAMRFDKVRLNITN